MGAHEREKAGVKADVDGGVEAYDTVRAEEGDEHRRAGEGAGEGFRVVELALDDLRPVLVAAYFG